MSDDIVSNLSRALDEILYEVNGGKVENHSKNSFWKRNNVMEHKNKQYVSKVLRFSDAVKRILEKYVQIREEIFDDKASMKVSMQWGLSDMEDDRTWLLSFEKHLETILSKYKDSESIACQMWIHVPTRERLGNVIMKFFIYPSPSMEAF